MRGDDAPPPYHVQLCIISIVCMNLHILKCTVHTAHVTHTHKRVACTSIAIFKYTHTRSCEKKNWFKINTQMRGEEKKKKEKLKIIKMYGRPMGTENDRV